MKLVAATLLVYATTICAAQAPGTVQPVPSTRKHFRLTFVLNDPQSSQSPQTIQLDVPVGPDLPGRASFNSAAGSIGHVEGSLQESMECTDVHRSPTGLAANVSFSKETILEPVAGVNEPIHQKITFNKQIDIVLKKTTQITDPNRLVPIGDAATKPPGGKHEALTITVTATEI